MLASILSSRRSLIILILIIIILIYIVFANNYLKKIEIPGNFKHSNRFHSKAFNTESTDNSISINNDELKQTEVVLDKTFINSNLNSVNKTLNTQQLNRTNSELILNKNSSLFNTTLLNNKNNDTTFNTTTTTTIRIIATKIIKVNNTASNYTTLNNNLEQCPMIPPNLGQRIPVNTEIAKVSFEELDVKLEKLALSAGGLYKPKECNARFKVAVIIPYRNRESNLKIFLNHMHAFLQKQQLDYGVYLVEPIQNLTFNRGLLMNIGFLQALNLTQNKWDCFVFHDVDLIPEDERNIYSCPEIPRHMSSAVSTFNYRLPYESIFGGVVALTKEQMYKSNGYSNLYFGWGGEDDDFRIRIVNQGYSISRYPLEIGRYLMANHNRDQKANPERFNLLHAAVSRIKKEGLTSIKYDLLKVDKKKLYTHILVSYNEKEILKTKS